VTSTIRYLSIFLSLIVAGILIYILGNLIIPQLYVSILGIIRDWPNIQRRIDAFTTWINTTRDNNQTIATYANEGIVRVKDYFENWVETDLLSKMNTWFNYFATGVLGFITVVKNLLIGIIVSIYVLLEKEHFAAQGKMIIYALFKTRPANVIIETLRESNRIFGGFIMGKIIDSMIIGLLCFIGLSILKMPYTLLVSVIVGVTNVIPFFGPYFGAIPSALLILFIDPMKCLYFLIFIIILQQIDGNIIGPAIIGDSTGLSAFWVIFSILGGGGLFGLVGMLIGVPTFAVIYYIIRTYIEYRLTSKELKSASQDYEDLDRINKENGITVYKHLSS
jgi:predicted PurR-regulated permease PerM